MKFLSTIIYDSQKQPCTVKVIFRYSPFYPDTKRIINCRVAILGRYESTYYGGRAICSFQDTFVKSIGRKIALTRAVSRLPQPQRKEIWQAYWRRHKRI